MKDTIIVNMFGGPGTGKSTTSARVFAMLKDEEVDCELVTEFAKDLVWEDRIATFDDDIYVFAKQNHRLFRVYGKVDVMVCDSPLLLKLVYMRSDLPMEELILATFNHYNNRNYFLKRVKAYNPNGRLQKDIEEAKAVDKEILTMLTKYDIPYHTAPGNKDGATDIVRNILNAMEKN